MKESGGRFFYFLHINVPFIHFHFLRLSKRLTFVSFFFAIAHKNISLRDGKKHGSGTYTWANGSKFSGEYRDARKEGHGRMTYNNGDVYEGERQIWNLLNFF